MFEKKRDFNDQRLKFQRGEGSLALKKRDVSQLVADAFDNSLYNQVGKERRDRYEGDRYYNRNRKDKVYLKNSKFWTETLLSYNSIGQRIRLKNFSVIEWLPSSPGLFFTGKAEVARRKAEAYFNPSDREYLPLGKLEMILGGIGSVRLGAEQTTQHSKYYLCGTSNGASHEGVPLIVERNLYISIISEIKEEGYCKGDIIGTIEILHTEKSIITFDREVPKYCIIVEDFIRANDIMDNLTVTIATAFQTEEHRWKTRHNDNYSHYGWTFCSFEPQKGDTNLVQAVNWINDYALRYSGSKEILCDFDEHKNHFDGVMFSQREIMSGRYNKGKLQEFSRFNQITINKIIMGDNFENVSGTVINRSIVSNSFNKVRGQIGEEEAHLLQHITEEVEKSGNKDAIELMEGFHQEIQKPEPKKSLLKSFWNGVVTAVPSLITNADKVLDLVEKASKILP